MRQGKTDNKKGKKRGSHTGTFILAICLTGMLIAAILLLKSHFTRKNPEDILSQYMNCIVLKQYEEMYSLVDVEGSETISLEDFTARNSAIYEGIETKNLKVDITEYDRKKLAVKYHTSLDTAAGNISFDNEAYFSKGKAGYRILWENGLIFPKLEASDTVRVERITAERGSILDRNDQVLAGKGTASSVGIIPGKLENRDNAIAEIAGLVEMNPESIERELEAQWVTDDTFVPIKTLPKINELDLMSPEPAKETVAEQERQEKLLAIPGIMISDTEIRQYPLGEAAAHLVGYIQNVTAEDLENHPGEDYTDNSVIGKSGMEGLYEKELKGQDGCSIYIMNAEGERKAELADEVVQNGQNIKLTIDADLQSALYEQFKMDKSCSVAMNPYTGEVLALMSAPSFDNNDFIRGMPDEEWTALNEDENQPLYNRFRQIWCPGSTFKPIVAGIGLQTGTVDPNEDFGDVGLAWQKDSSWGDYQVTTLHEYEPVIMKNAIMYSDNIYFAKAALKIGADNLAKSLHTLGFDQELPFETQMTESQYSNTDQIETEIQLADSGYGQGQILVNPLHLASIYTAFLNEGNMIKPYLQYKEDAAGEVWITDAFTAENAGMVMEAVKSVVNDPNGTGYAAHRDDIVLAGKTGTAEIKATKEDTTGTEIGWFSVFTAEKDAPNPILLISMVENVKEIGGCGYVIRKDVTVLDGYL
ncbi:penicillin-binding transpeptidase domain-containing protein [Hespellia stercorisuis]|uniref:Penicillin-binding protein n=1 Tax=Hespellia stercorisuis DSM 15480 TaxID=1121950 RepID=A0A1M6UGC9_9FIRM|nr:penicillin-binding transpeptidase domain-containing protein [Hespellia stercorisuis]SHK68229.1 penicillin-binding protein [Hespellia stercorisuis DSM 15480]